MSVHLEMQPHRQQQEQANLLAHGVDNQGRQYQYVTSGVPNPVPQPQQIYSGQQISPSSTSCVCKKFDMIDKVLIVGAISTGSCTK